MKARNVTIHAAALVLLLAGSASAQKVAAAGAKPVKCTNPATKVTILSGVLYGDAKGGVYTEGVDGVYNTVVWACPGASNDATMGLITSRRSLGFTFPSPITDSVIGDAPAWANSSFLAKPFMNVRNILWGRKNFCTTPCTFTTRIGFSYISGPGDNGTNYRLVHAPLLTDSLVFGTTEENSPNFTTPATVEDIPGNCRTVSGGSFDKWIVTVDSSVGTPDPASSVGTLMRDVNNGSAVQSGQYSMPFKLMIEAKTCLPG